MHVATTMIFEAGPLRTEGGGIDFAAFRRANEAALHRIPRYRQKLDYTPIEAWPVWVDDESFNLDYHLRHVALPDPGSELQLQELAGRIRSTPLDREKPLWEAWLVEGLEEDRFAVITKIHHAMIDGASGMGLAEILFSPEPDYQLPAAPRYIPRRRPSRFELLRDMALRRLSLPLRMLSSLRGLQRETEDLLAEVRVRTRALGELIGTAARQPSETPISGPNSPHRRFTWRVLPLDEVRAVRRKLGCSLNDVVLATVTGAVRSFLQRRQSDPASLRFRVSAPVSMRAPGDMTAGNQVSTWNLDLPVHEADRIAQVERIFAVTRHLKDSRNALAIDMMMQVADWMPMGLLALGSRSIQGQTNMIVTNVPGPQVPLYLLGAKLLGMYPQVPLIPGTGIGVALISYDGRLCWGFNGDYELVPDLDLFAQDVEASFKDLTMAATSEAGRLPLPR
jgi:WS/DGAT/MGAT family acyltransferase